MRFHESRNWVTTRMWRKMTCFVPPFCSEIVAHLIDHHQVIIAVGFSLGGKDANSTPRGWLDRSRPI